MSTAPVRVSRKTLLTGADSRVARNDAMAWACLDHSYTLTEIGRAVGLHYATISRIIKTREIIIIQAVTLILCF